MKKTDCSRRQNQGRCPGMERSFRRESRQRARHLAQPSWLWSAAAQGGMAPELRSSEGALPSSLTGARKAHQRPGAWLLGSVIAQEPSGPKSSSVALAMGDPKAPKQVRATCMPENNGRTKEGAVQYSVRKQQGTSFNVHSASSTVLKGDSGPEATKKKTPHLHLAQLLRTPHPASRCPQRAEKKTKNAGQNAMKHPPGLTWTSFSTPVAAPG